MSKQGSNHPTEDDTWVKKKKRKGGKKSYGLEYKAKRERVGWAMSSWFGQRYKEWRPYFKKYKTEKQRDQALETLNKADNHFQYRKAKDD